MMIKITVQALKMNRRLFSNSKARKGKMILLLKKKRDTKSSKQFHQKKKRFQQLQVLHSLSESMLYHHQLKNQHQLYFSTMKSTYLFLLFPNPTTESFLIWNRAMQEEGGKRISSFFHYYYLSWLLLGFSCLDYTF